MPSEAKELKLTLKLAKETVKASHPRACCRHGWNTIDGVRRDRWEIFRTLATSGHFVGRSYRSPVALGRSFESASEAWKEAARKLIAVVNEVSQ